MLEQLQNILAMLRAQHWLYYSFHWAAADYQRHLLFERLYGGLPEEFDGLAEKLVALFGVAAVDPTDSMRRGITLMNGWLVLAEAEAAALKSEYDLAAAIETAVRTAPVLAGNPRDSVGVDDFLRGVANNHQTNLYLLKQSQQAD